MKKVLLLTGALLLVAAGAMFVASCSSDDEIETKSYVSPIEDGDEYAAIAKFFNSELPCNTGDFQTSDFFINTQEYNIQKNVCCVINDKKGLEGIYYGEKVLPEIDFEKYTLIIGVERMPHLSYKLAKKELIICNGYLLFNLYVSEPKDRYHPTAILSMFYWGLYPKVEDKEIVVKTIILQ